MNITEIKQQIKSITDLYPEGKILDLCSGNGGFLEFIKDEIIDFSERIATDNHNRKIDNDFFEFIRSDIYEIDFPENYFDIITLSNSLHHLEHLDVVFSMIKKILKKDGLLIINEMFSDEQNPDQMTHVMLHHFSADINKLENIYHRETYKKNEILEIIKNNGFSVKNTFEYRINSSVNLSPIIESLLEKVPNENKKEFEIKSEVIIENYMIHGFDNATELLVFCQIFYK